MEREQAYFAVSLLVGSIGSQAMWPNETIDSYVAMLEDLADGDLLIRTCQEIAQSWNSQGDQYGKPTPGFIRRAYGQNVMRRELDRPTQAIEEGGRNIPAWRDGVEIARQAYYDECRKLGREPNDARFESMLARAIGRAS
jgi:hypothetical protein